MGVSLPLRLRHPRDKSLFAACPLYQSDKNSGAESAGRQMKDFIYYRCGGSDGYRFGGERICSNSQVQAGFLETAVWREVCNLLMNPEKIELEHEERSKAGLR